MPDPRLAARRSVLLLLAATMVTIIALVLDQREVNVYAQTAQTDAPLEE